MRKAPTTQAKPEQKLFPPVLRVRVLSAVMAILALCYLVEIRAPLRLTPDAIAYLQMTKSAVRGNGFLVDGVKSHFPAGYPAMLAALDLMGLGTNAAFVALNCVFLAVALAAAYRLLRKVFGFEPWFALLLCCLTMLAGACIRQVGWPLSDMPYMGFSLACLAAIASADRLTGWRSWSVTALAFAMAVAATSIRTVGIVLVPSLLWACVVRRKPVPEIIRQLRSDKRVMAVLAAAALAALGVAVVIATRTLYFRDMVDRYAQGGFVAVVGRTLNWRLSEFGMIAMNAATAEAPLYMRAAGLAAICLTARGLWKRRRVFAATDVYVLLYALFMATWPYSDDRFWLPLVPLLLALWTMGLRGLIPRPVPRLAVVAYLALFAFLGYQIMDDEIRVSLSGRNFPERYWYSRFDPSFMATYRKAFGSKEEFDPAAVDPRALEVLQWYEPLARPNKGG